MVSFICNQLYPPFCFCFVPTLLEMFDLTNRVSERVEEISGNEPKNLFFFLFELGRGSCPAGFIYFWKESLFLKKKKKTRRKCYCNARTIYVHFLLTCLFLCCVLGCTEADQPGRKCSITLFFLETILSFFFCFFFFFLFHPSACDSIFWKAGKWFTINNMKPKEEIKSVPTFPAIGPHIEHWLW